MSRRLIVVFTVVGLAALAMLGWWVAGAAEPSSINGTQDDGTGIPAVGEGAIGPGDAATSERVDAAPDGAIKVDPERPGSLPPGIRVTSVELEDASPEEKAADAASRVVAPYEPWDAERLLATVEAAVEQRRTDLNLADAPRFSRTAADYIIAWWNSDYAELGTLLRERDLEFSTRLQGESASTFGGATARSIHHAPVDYDEIEVKLYARDGKLLDPPTERPAGVSSNRVTRARGERDVIDPLGAGADVVMVDVPAHLWGLHSASGVKGMMTFYFVERPDDGAWLPIAIEGVGPGGRHARKARENFFIIPLLE